MTTTNEESKKDLRRYAKITLWSSFIFLSVLITALVFAHVFKEPEATNFLFGLIMGAILAISNLFAIGYAFFRLIIKQEKRWALLVPVSSFLLMCLIAFFIALFWTVFIFGFAIGLVTPVLIGTILVYLNRKPA